MTKAEKRQEWKSRVVAYRASGQSAAEFCAAHNLRPNQLWYWLRKLEPFEKTAVLPSQWLSVEVGNLGLTAQDNGLLIRIGQAVIEVQPGFNPALLKDVVRTLTLLC
jgi:hypothetical protein